MVLVSHNVICISVISMTNRPGSRPGLNAVFGDEEEKNTNTANKCVTGRCRSLEVTLFHNKASLILKDAQGCKILGDTYCCKSIETKMWITVTITPFYSFTFFKKTNSIHVWTTG